jgi:tetratricopeptide (TPR) repeat protein
LIVRKDGYERVALLLTIISNQTNAFRTNLVSVAYVNAVTLAKQYLAAADYDRALEAANVALEGNPGDAVALELQKKAAAQQRIRRAEIFAQRKDYPAAIHELEYLLQTEPENEQAKQLLAEFHNRQEQSNQEEKTKSRRTACGKTKARAASPSKTDLDAQCQQHEDSELFGTQSFFTRSSIREIAENICAALTNGSPKLEIQTYSWPYEEAFLIEAKQRLLLGSGSRVFVIAGGQTGDSQTSILAKVLEYENHINVNLGIIKVSDGQPSTTALHPSRSRLSPQLIEDRTQEGIKILRERIQNAIKEPSASF